MSEIKEKSAVGAATPATEMSNNPTVSINHDDGKIKMIPTENLVHHPDNPRKSIGDIEELTDSIRKNGVMQNLTVVPAEDELGKFWVLIGNRRFEAAKRAGLEELPCRVAEGLSKIEQIGIMLEENMQRADLTIVEQAQGFQLMLDMGETVAGIAQRTGFSESTIRRRVKLNELDGDALSKAMTSFQLTISDVAELEKVENVEKRNDLLKKAYSADDLRGKIGAAVREQERKKDIGLISGRLREMGLKEISVKSEHLWSSAWDRIGSIRYDEDPGKLGQIGDIEGVVFGEYGGTIYLLRKKPKKKEKEKISPEEKKRKEIEKRRKQVEAISRQIVDDMKIFMKEKIVDSGILGHKDKVSDRETREAWEVLIESGYAHIFMSVLCEPLLSGGWHGSTDEEKKKAKGQLRKVPCAYQMAWCFLNQSIGELMNYNGRRSNTAAVLERLYHLLRIWGFRFEEGKEDELEVVLDGTSELYIKEENTDV